MSKLVTALPVQQWQAGGFMSRFMPGGQPQQGQHQPTDPQGQPGQPTSQQTGAPTEPPQPTAPENPLDAFSGLFDNTEGGEAENLPPAFTLSQDTLTEVANGMDFTRGVTAEDLQAVQGGDTEALLKLIQHVGRQSYMNAVQHNAALTDKYVNARSDYDRQNVAPAVREQLVGQEMEKGYSKEAWSNPVVKGQLVDVAKRLHKRYPDANPSWIAEQSKQYLQQVTAQALGLDITSLQNPQQKGQPGQVAEVDWEKELGL